jgi:hypothetical protein
MQREISDLLPNDAIEVIPMPLYLLVVILFNLFGAFAENVPLIGSSLSTRLVFVPWWRAN